MLKTLSYTRKSKSGEFQYVEAQLKEFDSGWVIEFYYTDSESGELVRHKVKKQRERIKFGDDRRARVAFDKECKTINKNLAAGWTPKGALISHNPEEEVGRLLEMFLAARQEDFREDTFRVYKSAAKRLKEWLDKTNNKRLSVYDFDAKKALAFFDYMGAQPKVGPVTYNNYLRMCKAIWSWFIDVRLFEIENPFRRIKTKRVSKTNKPTVPPELDEMVLGYCRKQDPVLELVIVLIYGCAIRVKEILRLRPESIDLQRGIIYIAEEDSKTHNARIIYPAAWVIEKIKEFNLHELSPKDYIIGKQCGRFAPLKIGAKKHLNTRDVDKNWEKLRTETGLDKKYTLYSYKYRVAGELYRRGLSTEKISTLTGHLSDAIDCYIPTEAKMEVAREVSMMIPQFNISEKSKEK